MNQIRVLSLKRIPRRSLQDFDDLLATVAFFNVPLVTTYQHRGDGLESIERLLDAWGLEMRVIPAEPFECYEDSLRPEHELQLLELRPAAEQ